MVLSNALASGPSHAYLFHGPAGVGKRTVARAFAAELLADGAADPDDVRMRVSHGVHPDLTWVRPSGAHVMRVDDVDEPVVMAATRTPFEVARRVFVLERVDTMNDEVANRLLKTLEEPAHFVHLVLLTDALGRVIETVVSRCQPVRFDPLPATELAQKLQSRGIDPETAAACARLSLGDGERALTLALTPELRARTEAFARAPIHGRAHEEQAWRPLLEQARKAGAAAKAEVEAALAEELEYLPKKEHRKRETEFTDRARRAERRAMTGALEHALQRPALAPRGLELQALRRLRRHGLLRRRAPGLGPVEDGPPCLARFAGQRRRGESLDLQAKLLPLR